MYGAACMACAKRRLTWPVPIGRLFPSRRRSMLLIAAFPLLVHPLFPGGQAVPFQITLEPEPLPPRLPLLGGALKMIDIAVLFPQHMEPA